MSLERLAKRRNAVDIRSDISRAGDSPVSDTKSERYGTPSVVTFVGVFIVVKTGIALVTGTALLVARAVTSQRTPALR